MSMRQQCLDEISNKFDTLFEQAENYEKINMYRNSKQVENYEKTDMDREHSKVIPTPMYSLSLMEGKNYSERKYLKSDKLEDKVEYLEIHKAVKDVLCYRTRMAKHHQ
ncbi:hypothetical protein JTB14_013961 [Gonioctena quinquepunctata]|nr:hypothetical protein JTB14_034375 [Gonioctena quinquepunctata]KAG5868895.1 hypothetical protein JTB14_013961 [Gonioctena quinquepunctata]